MLPAEQLSSLPVYNDAGGDPSRGGVEWTSEREWDWKHQGTGLLPGQRKAWGCSWRIQYQIWPLGRAGYIFQGCGISQYLENESLGYLEIKKKLCISKYKKNNYYILNKQTHKYIKSKKYTLF